jgi:hypothetical protein
VFALVKICDRLSVALAHRPRTGPPAASSRSAHVTRDAELAALLSGDREVSAAEALGIVQSWPSPAHAYTEDQLGTWAVFYDLIRLVWFHELAHALCGHIGFAKDTLGVMAVHASAAGASERSSTRMADGSTSEVLQCLEMHADEFAVRLSLGEILYGHDPPGLMVRSRVDLGDRLLHLNTAFCVFAVLWELDERKRPLQAAWTERTHPPADLRYDRFRSYQRELAIDYDTRLLTVVDTLSLAFLQVLTKASPFFGDLARLTPLLLRTPSMTEVERYEQHLLRLEPVIAAGLELHGFIPAEFLDVRQ